MLQDRNLTSHTYDEAGAKEIYERVKAAYLEHLMNLAETIEGDLK